MRAVVTGISGQDGFHMARLLCERGIEVIGLTTNLQKAALDYDAAGAPRVTLASFDPNRVGAFAAIVEDVQPDLIFNFAAKATGRGMFDLPFEMTQVNGAFVLDILEAIRNSPNPQNIAFCQASSSEMFGFVDESPQNESTPFRPRSPYGAAKLYAHNLVGIYRTTYQMRCCSAILYNHESNRRTTDFVTKKIAHGAAAIKLGLADCLSIGYVGSMRDWGYAPEYVTAMYTMAMAPVSADYVVATGRLTTVARLLEIAFGHLGLDYKRFVVTNVDEGRVAESINLCGDAQRIARELGWRACRTVDEIMVEMVDFELNRLEGSDR